MQQKEWFVRLAASSRTQCRLICLPYAGGGVGVYRSWARQAPAALELWAVRLPGRETLQSAPPIRRLEIIVPVIAAAIAECGDAPFALYGHSMGALLAFEVARTLAGGGGPVPRRLIVGAARAPDLPPAAPPIHQISDEALLAELRALNGTPTELLAEPEWRDVLLQTLRADFEVVETYRHAQGSMLSAPIHAFGGLHDDRVSRDAIEGWRRHTTQRFTCAMIDGGHFFLRDASATFPSLIMNLALAGDDQAHSLHQVVSA